MTRNFEIVWSGVTQELGRKTIPCPDLDTAVIAAWQQLPDVARAARLPCATITVRDAATGQGVIEDVINDPPAERIWMQPLFTLVCAISGLVAYVWMRRLGLLSDLPRNARSLLMIAFPAGFPFAVVTLVLGHERKRKAAEQWKKDFGNIAPPTLPPHPRSHRIVVTRHSLLHMIPKMLLVLGIAAVCLWFALNHRLHATGWTPWYLFLAIAGVTLSLFAINSLRQIWRDRGAAVWIESGEIFHGNTIKSSVLDVRGVTADGYASAQGMSYDAVILKNAQGEEAPIDALGLRDSSEVVAARLAALLRLPPQERAP
jgi:hypothetical protein